jgi:Protein of unknown function (DUF1559)
MTLSLRRTWLIVAGLGFLAVAAPLAAAPTAIHPLDRVPADAGLFAHFDAASLWDAHPAVLELRKSYAKELEKGLQSVEKETGLRPEQINTLTFHFPKFPQGDGDQRLFVLQVTTKKPYDKNTLLAGFRAKDEGVKGDLIKLQDNMFAHLTSETQFTVVHESLLEDFKKGPVKAKDGIMTEAIQAARAGKNNLTVALDPSGLPAEIFTSAPPELQPFLPLLKSKSILLQANLGKELTAHIRFAGEKEDHAIESELAFNLLMKLADDGIGTLLKEEKPSEDIKALLPALTEIQKVVRGVKADRQGLVTSAKASLKVDPALVKPIVAVVLKPFTASARSQSANNLKQIGLAMHNYHDANGVLPAAAICDKKGKPLLSWRVAILPYIEQNNLYKQFKLDEPWDSEHNIKLSKAPKTYRLPYGEPKEGHTNYRVFVGNGAAFDSIQGARFSQFTDGLSNTLMVFEAAESTPWTKPDEIEFDPKKEMKKHLRFEDGKICQILFCDGSVRAIPEKLTDAILKLFIQRDDGMPIPSLDQE